ncbi:MAG TPA: hypothetical protein VEY51_01235 [Chondromyces sp.]|nr:hypothetical protein [Chondromyces sp.]
MTQKVYQLKYDDVYDGDIDEWLKQIPSSKKAEYIRHALRFYIAYAGNSKTPIMPGIHQMLRASAETVKEVKKERPRSLPVDGRF